MQSLLASFVSRIVQRGDLELVFSDGTRRRFGDGSGGLIVAHFADARGPAELLRNPELALGELYMNGRFVVTEGTMFDLLSLVMSNAIRTQPPRFMRAIRAARDAGAALMRNGRRRAQANVAHHYDLDGRIYDLFLDADRQYSCAYFERPEMSLEEAQLAKKRHIAAKLLLREGDVVLDIGSGWGGMALYLSRHCGALVEGVTLSEEQLAVSRERVEAARLWHRVKFHMQDYRDVAGSYDRIVSVGMFEHVGPAHFAAYFEKIAELLDDDGVALVHTIGRPDGPGATNPWVRKYIFPGGYIPSLSEIATAVEKAGLYITDVEVLRMHYAETLKAWRARFLARWDEAKAIYDERFCRMWDFYLSICELTFRIEGESVFQLQLAKRHDRVPITRDYIAREETRLRRLDTPASGAEKLAAE